jgi:hypothetical protein
MNVKHALSIAPKGSAVLRGAVRIEVCPGVSVETMAIKTPTEVWVPIDARLPDGGYVRALVQLDHATYARALAAAERHGGVPVLVGMVQKYANEHIDFRRILPR